MATEKRLIDVYKLEKLVEGHRAAYFHRDDIVAAIAAQPTVDAVEVVRCKDCKYRHTRATCQGRRMEFFCADGERKYNEQ